jgi:glycosyltransferase involved in cell wall biosynthesis
VVIPAHGPGPFLAEAVASALAEEPAEVIVVEDGTAGVDEAALGGARLLRLPHVRRSRARNAGVDAARTPFVAFLDEDDLCLPGRLERQRDVLAGAGELCFGRVRVVAEDGTPDDEWNALLDARFARIASEGASFESILAVPAPIYTSATMVRRDAFLDVGGFDPAFDANEDLDLYLRLSRRARLRPCPGEAVSVYRLHGANTPSDALYEAAVLLVDKHLPAATGRSRGLLLERRADALWGLGRFRAARLTAFRAAFESPSLVAQPRFARRLAALALPTRALEARR